MDGMMEMFEEINPEVFELGGFVPVPVEPVGGGRITDRTEPTPANVVLVQGTGGKVPLQRHAAAALRAMTDAARAAGLAAPLLLPTSGYRSVARQRVLWQEALARYGTPEKARKWVAPPGGSAHHSGRAVDLHLGGRNRSTEVDRLRQTRAWKWLVANAQRFGFYPYEAEPWHWEYNPPAPGRPPPRASAPMPAPAARAATAAVVGASAGAAAGAVAGAVKHAGPCPIDGYQYDNAHHCVGGRQPPVPVGMKAFLEEFLFPRFGRRRVVPVVCRPIRGKTAPSLHSEGRAADYPLDANNPADRAIGDRIVQTLLAPDAAGNQHALARRLGVQEIIWNRQIWTSSRWRSGVRPYGGVSPHTDHIHIGLNRLGALKGTSYWTCNAR